MVREIGGAITVEEIKVDPPKASEVRIKMLCASICHTDILACNGMPFVSPIFVSSFESDHILSSKF